MARKRLAVFLAGLDKEYQREYVLGLTETAARLDADVMVFARQGYPEIPLVCTEAGESEIFDLPDLTDFDGIAVLMNTIPDPEAAAKLTERLAAVSHIPQVFLDTDGLYGTRIDFDDATSVAQLTDHLIHEHGCKRFAMITGPEDNPVALTRAGVIRRRIAENGRELALERAGNWTRGAGLDFAE